MCSAFLIWTYLTVGSADALSAGTCNPKVVLKRGFSRLNLTVGGGVLVEVDLISLGSTRSEMRFENRILSKFLLKSNLRGI